MAHKTFPCSDDCPQYNDCQRQCFHHVKIGKQIKIVYHCGPKIYQLSAYGKALTYKTWRFIGGCGLPNDTQAYRNLGPQAKWNDALTLGEIESACPYTGRSFARFAVTRLNMPEFAAEYEV